MAKYRTINVKFWDDTYTCNLDPIEKLLFLYIFSNPLTKISGIYEIQTKRIAFDTGIDKEMVEKVLKRFSEDGKITYSDGWIYVKNFIKNQSINASVLQGIEREIQDIPYAIIEKLKIEWIQPVDRVGTACGEGVDKPILILNLTKLNLYLTTTTAVSKVEFDFKKGRFQNLTDNFVLLMKEKFPAVNIKSELSKMEAWFIANPKNKKSNYERFIVNWLTKTQDRSREGGNSGASRQSNKTTGGKYDGIAAVAE